MTSKPEKPYRVFVTRHYIAVDYFDIVAKTSAQARKLARKAAYKIRPDARHEATDNGWIADNPLILENGLGSSAAGIAPLTEIIPGVFRDADKNAPQ